ncbi:MAG TPA: DUF3465 domain-containing protein [Steroidobacteraceae bacterium]|nr:DUF3465 domain-containing protein [Steroidobacteraceae bacterium]
MRKLFAFVCLLGVLYALAVLHGLLPAPGWSSVAIGAESACDGADIAAAWRNHQRNVEVCGRAVVDRVLRDDLEGSRHQKFIVRMADGQTLLIAYNIDIATRIDGISAGEPIEFAGEYEWTRQGGVVHWTHHDPQGRHRDGWIRYHGHLYQ